MLLRFQLVNLMKLFWLLKLLGLWVEWDFRLEKLEGSFTDNLFTSLRRYYDVLFFRFTLEIGCKVKILKSSLFFLVLFSFKARVLYFDVPESVGWYWVYLIVLSFIFFDIFDLIFLLLLVWIFPIYINHPLDKFAKHFFIFQNIIKSKFSDPILQFQIWIILDML